MHEDDVAGPDRFGRPLEIANGISVEFFPAGHLLGSSFVRLTLEGGPLAVVQDGANGTTYSQTANCW